MSHRWLCVRWLCVLALACSLIYSQTAEPAFEVASVKYVGPYDSEKGLSQRGGPGTSDPTRITYENVTTLILLVRAYGVDFDQISGPAWLDSIQYTVIANVRAGTAKVEVPIMWQQLLKQRFHLAVHHEVKDLPRYELAVAKGGPKLRPSAGDPGKPAPGVRPTQGADGFPILPPGARHFFYQPIENGVRVTRETFRDYSMQELAQELAWPLGELSWEHVMSVGRIVDKTGLLGKYDFRLEYAGTHSAGGAFAQSGADGQPSGVPDLFDAVQRQLGLKIEASKAPTEILVVDHVDRMPTEN
jgi:uncharacterized protein (TIGR03435 family)